MSIFYILNNRTLDTAAPPAVLDQPQTRATPGGGTPPRPSGRVRVENPAKIKKTVEMVSKSTICYNFLYNTRILREVLAKRENTHHVY